MGSSMIQSIVWKQVLIGITLSLFPGLSLAQAEGLTHHAVVTNDPETLQVGLGASLIIDSPAPFSRASVADPEIADPLVLSTKQIYLTGKKIGATTLTLWGKNKQVSNVFNILVTPDLTKLKAQLHLLFPQEKKIKVTGGTRWVDAFRDGHECGEFISDRVDGRTLCS